MGGGGGGSPPGRDHISPVKGPNYWVHAPLTLNPEYPYITLYITWTLRVSLTKDEGLSFKVLGLTSGVRDSIPKGPGR